jgi:hypothetical protein
MTLAILVIAQVAVFQFLSISFTRSLFRLLLGDAPEPASGKAATYIRGAARQRFFLGGLLALVALAILVGLPAAVGARKVLLAAVSLVSTAAFVIASVAERKAASSIAAELPGFGLRRASLQPRTLSRWYHPAWESVPIAIFIATSIVALVLWSRLDQTPVSMWVLLPIQGVFVSGALLYTVSHGVRVANVSSRFVALRDQPEVALRFSERLAGVQMRYFMLVKVCISLLFGIGALHTGLEVLAPAAGPFLAALRWGTVITLLTAYAAYLLQIVTLTRHLQRHLQPPSEATVKGT